VPGGSRSPRAGNVWRFCTHRNQFAQKFTEIEKLGRAQRPLSRSKKRSHNRSQAKLRVARVQERVANLRKEFVHQLSHQLVERWDVVCVEDLNLKSLAKTKQAKSWLDASFGELFRQIEYKSLWNSKHFVRVDRFFASSQLCSACGYKNNDLRLSERQWKCPAAINIRRERSKDTRCADAQRVETPRDHV
jgi:putative transposase